MNKSNLISLKNSINKIQEEDGRDLLGALIIIREHIPLLKRIILGHIKPIENKLINSEEKNKLVKKLLETIGSIDIDEYGNKINLLISHIESVPNR